MAEERPKPTKNEIGTDPYDIASMYYMILYCVIFPYFDLICHFNLLLLFHGINVGRRTDQDGVR